MEYITEQGELATEGPNHWELVGVDLESIYRGEVIEVVNNGALETGVIRKKQAGRF